MIERSDLSLPVYELLKKMILSEELKPGEKLLQEKLALRLGVSRTPLLKALQMLEYDFLVESIPRRGMFVRKLNIREMIDIYDVREGIESVAARLCAERITEEQLRVLSSIWEPFLVMDPINEHDYREADEKFHALLLEFSQNLVLKKTYSLAFLQARVLQLGLMRPPAETLPEHIELIAALRNRDIPAAEKAIRKHINKSKESIFQKF